MRYGLTVMISIQTAIENTHHDRIDNPADEENLFFVPTTNPVQQLFHDPYSFAFINLNCQHIITGHYISLSNSLVNT